MTWWGTDEALSQPQFPAKPLWKKEMMSVGRGSHRYVPQIFHWVKCSDKNGFKQVTLPKTIITIFIFVKIHKIKKQSHITRCDFYTFGHIPECPQCPINEMNTVSVLPVSLGCDEYQFRDHEHTLWKQWACPPSLYPWDNLDIWAQLSWPHLNVLNQLRNAICLGTNLGEVLVVMLP